VSTLIGRPFRSKKGAPRFCFEKVIDIQAALCPESLKE
jgi:hypothetical protein